MPLHPDTENWLNRRREWLEKLADAFKGEQSDGYKQALADRAQPIEEGEEAEEAEDAAPKPQLIGGYEVYGLKCRRKGGDGGAFDDGDDDDCAEEDEEEEVEGEDFTPIDYFLEVLAEYSDVCASVDRSGLASALSQAFSSSKRGPVRDTIPLQRQLATLESFARACRHRNAAFADHMLWWCDCLRNIEQSDQELRTLLSGGPIGLARFVGSAD